MRSPKMSRPLVHSARIALALAGWPAAAIARTGCGWIAAQLPHGHLAEPPLVSIQSGATTFPQPGEFLRANLPVAGPSVAVHFDGGFDIMRYEVSAADYARCV